jgi:hypothetical protein
MDTPSRANASARAIIIPRTAPENAGATRIAADMVGVLLHRGARSAAQTLADSGFLPHEVLAFGAGAAAEAAKIEALMASYRAERAAAAQALEPRRALARIGAAADVFQAFAA